MKKVVPVLSIIGRALDGLNIGFCAYDDRLRLLSFNSTFLAFFPEHSQDIQRGEHYAENLERFYRARLQPDELHELPRLVADGVERHRHQERPFEFNHRARRLRASSLAVPGLLRVRIWRDMGEAPADPADPLRCEGAVAPAHPVLRGDLSDLLQRIVDGVLVTTDAGDIVDANRPFLQMYGVPDLPSAVGRPFDALLRQCWNDQRPPAAGLPSLADSLHFSGAPFEIPLPDDRWIRVVEQPGAGSDGRRYFLHLDITEIKRKQKQTLLAEQKARESEARYRLLAEYSSDVTISIRRGRVIYVSPAIRKMLDWAPERIVGRHIARLVHAQDRASLDKVVVAAALGHEGECRLRALRPDGRSLWVEAKARVFADGDGVSAGVVVNVRDIAARKGIEEQLEAALLALQQVADADGLTGVANRRKFDQVLALELRRARRSAAPFALLLLDIDHFKAVNDDYGHLAGDEVLRLVAATLQRGLRRAADLVARYGGEEFAVLLPDTSAEEAARLAELLRATVETLPMPPGLPRVTVSCGVVASPDLQRCALSAVELVAVADRALYRAKRGGRNQVQVELLAPAA